MVLFLMTYCPTKYASPDNFFLVEFAYLELYMHLNQYLQNALFEIVCSLIIDIWIIKQCKIPWLSIMFIIQGIMSMTLM